MKNQTLSNCAFLHPVWMPVRYMICPGDKSGQLTKTIVTHVTQHEGPAYYTHHHGYSGHQYSTHYDHGYTGYTTHHYGTHYGDGDGIHYGDGTHVVHVHHYHYHPSSTSTVHYSEDSADSEDSDLPVALAKWAHPYVVWAEFFWCNDIPHDS